MTVAIAAPGAPSLHTLMSIGSRIILVIAPTSCVTIGTIILPIACNMRLSMVSIIKPKEQHMQIVRYVEPILYTACTFSLPATAPASTVYALMKASDTKYPSTKNSALNMKDIKSPVCAARLASLFLPSPSNLDISEPAPTARPIANAFTSSCMGIA